MVSSAATTVDAYLASLVADRRAAIARVREIVNANLPSGFEEGMQYGMICWYVPLARYPDTYNGQALGLAAQAVRAATTKPSSARAVRAAAKRPKPKSKSKSKPKPTKRKRAR